MRIPQPIPYQGSKRGIANSILYYFPESLETLVEPFAGSAAITIAAAKHNKSRYFHLNDINEPLMNLWKLIIEQPETISERYERIWKEQDTTTNTYYNKVRADFNITHEPGEFLYLLARCVKGSVRYNAQGEFNQAPDKRRAGKNPKMMREDIFRISALLKNKTKITSEDYTSIFKRAQETDLLYLDPPYQGVCENRDTRYFNKVDYNEFVDALTLLNERKIPYILSYDGKTGDKSYGKELPKALNLKKIVIHAGRSTQATLLGRSQVTYESVYLSPILIKKLGKPVLIVSQSRL